MIFFRADNMAKMPQQKIEVVMDHFSQACDHYNLTISIKNTKVVHQPVPGKLYNDPSSQWKDNN